MAEVSDEATLTIVVTGAPEEPVVELSGELDASNAARVGEVVDRQLSHHPSSICFDLSDLRFIDTTGIALLITASKAVDSVKVVAASPAVRAVIRLTGLTERFGMDP